MNAEAKEVEMSPKDDIQRQIAELDVRRSKLVKALQEREEQYRSDLRQLVEASQHDRTYKNELLELLGLPNSNKPKTGIKVWVLRTIGGNPNRFDAAKLRQLFRDEFGPSRVPSLRQYLTKPFGLVHKTDGKLALTKKGQSLLRRLPSQTAIDPS